MDASHAASLAQVGEQEAMHGGDYVTGGGERAMAGP